jgi:DNA-binding transcriptional MerR regulator
MMTPNHPSTAPKPHPAPDPSFRSGAVARMASMPVATLRTWEQRYRAVQPVTASSGHRLYSPADVERVLLLRQLTGQGHAIGSIALLDSSQLQQLVRQSGFPLKGEAVGAASRGARPLSALRLVVVGPALAARLQRPSVARHLGHALQQVAVFNSLSEAAQASLGAAPDLLIWHAPELRSGASAELHAAQRACGAGRVAVVYRFSGSAATRSLADAGVATFREPADDDALGTWLASIEAGLAARVNEVLEAREIEAQSPTSAPGHVPPRRYDDAALTAIAGLSPTLACECPRHVAELLMQLSSFEAYSAGCINRDSADAQLHTHLKQVAGAARALFEAALERVARHEGLSLP